MGKSPDLWGKSASNRSAQQGTIQMVLLLCFLGVWGGMLPFSTAHGQLTFATKVGTANSDDERGSAIAVTPDGGYIVAGSHLLASPTGFDSYVAKLSGGGLTQWGVTVGHPTPGTYRIAHRIIPAVDGGFVLSGEAFLGPTGQQISLFKIDGFGNVVWSRLLVGSSGSGSQGETALDLAADPGGYVLCGQTQGTADAVQAPILLRTDASGTVSWVKHFNDSRYGSGTFARFNDVRPEAGLGYVVAGMTSAGVGAQQQSLVLRTDLLGNVLWAKTYDRPLHDRAMSVQPAANGDYLVAGNTVVGESGANYLMRIDGGGNLLWYRTFSSFYNDFPRVRESSTGDAIVSGSSGIAGIPGAALINTTSTGTLQWAWNYGVDQYGNGEDFVIAADGGYALVGMTGTPGNSGGQPPFFQYHVVKTDPDGLVGGCEEAFDPGIDSDTPPVTAITLNVFSLLSQINDSLVDTDAPDLDTTVCFPSGACCLPNGSCVLVNGLSECDFLGGFYQGDGSDCTPNPCLGQLIACKFKDENCNGIQDPGETGLAGVTIRANGPGGSLSGVTDAGGCVDFGAILPGTYTVREDVPSDMVQTAPTTVFSTVTVLAGEGAAAPLFGNADTLCLDTLLIDTCRAGRNDSFLTTDGSELASPSTALCALITSGFLGGPLDDCNPPNCSEFDCAHTNRGFGHTFSGCWDSTCCVLGARLNFRVRSAGGEADNDGIGIYADNGAGGFVGVWGIPFATIDPTWPANVLTASLDLENLPASSIGITNILATLQSGELNVIIQDDSEIDYLELIVTTCCHCVEPPDSMVAWWTFDQEDTLNFNDRAGAVNNVGAYIGSAPNVPPGCIDRAVSLDGTDFVSVTDQAELNFGTGNFTIDAWIRTTATGIRPIVDKRSGTGGVGDPLVGYALLLFNGNLGFQMADGVGSGCVCGLGAQCDNNFSSGPNLADGRCHHVAVTVDRVTATGTLYVDGASVHTFTPRNGNLDNPADLWIGRRHLNPCGLSEAYWVGEIDELEMFNRSLTPNEIMALAGPAGKCKDCCDCPFQGDLNGDGFVDAVDLAILIDIVFFGAPDVQDPCCPTTRGDFNGDGFVDATDLAFLIDYVFFGGIGPTDPCGP
ncbi:MAG: LamG-like jellyroll fold domain-containing protein [Candidatus Zixiibacteriota bacterium]